MSKIIKLLTIRKINKCKIVRLAVAKNLELPRIINDKCEGYFIEHGCEECQMCKTNYLYDDYQFGGNIKHCRKCGQRLE